MDIVTRLNMKERIETCMESQCAQPTQHAEKVIEAENKRRMEFKKKYVLLPEEFLAGKYSSVESVAAVMDAEECLKRCQRGRDLIAKTLEQNL